jgi:hypothetical protein
MDYVLSILEKVEQTSLPTPENWEPPTFIVEDYNGLRLTPLPQMLRNWNKLWYFTRYMTPSELKQTKLLVNNELEDYTEDKCVSFALLPFPWRPPANLKTFCEYLILFNKEGLCIREWFKLRNNVDFLNTFTKQEFSQLFLGDLAWYEWTSEHSMARHIVGRLSECSPDEKNCVGPFSDRILSSTEIASDELLERAFRSLSAESLDFVLQVFYFYLKKMDVLL